MTKKPIVIVTEKFAEIAKSCKGLKTSDGSFQECVRKGMKGFKAEVDENGGSS